MPEKFENIGLFYQKYYFKGIAFDNNGDYKTTQATLIKERNSILFRSNSINNQHFHSSDGFQTLKLRSIYPGVITGIGMKHETAIKGELKLGMYFDYSSGMPCIPGASVKGALRSAFPQLEKHKKSSNEIKIAKCYVLNEILSKINPSSFPVITKEPTACNFSDFKKITELEEEIFDGKNFNEQSINERGRMKPFLSVYEKDIFYDAFIIKPDKDGRILGYDAITNHPDPLKSPNPVFFLKMLPGIILQFNFDLKDSTKLSANQKKQLFEEIIKYYGVGAKTNVGYGQFDSHI